MILVDTSVWIDHLRHGNARLSDALMAGDVLCHPFVAGELACGSLKQRTRILALLDTLPRATMAGHAEVLGMIEARNLMSRGLGFVDMHLLASVMLDGARLLSLDKRLVQTALALGVGIAA